MDFAPFGLTLGDWATILAMAAAGVAFVKKGFIPWMQTAMENSIASDRGIRAAIQEALKDDIAQVRGLKDSVTQLTTAMTVTVTEHRETRKAFGDLHLMVADLRKLFELELAQLKYRMTQFEREQRRLNSGADEP